MKRALYIILTVLVVIGVWRGIANYATDTGTNPIARIFGAIINTVQDLTYRWIPNVIDFFGNGLPQWISTW